MQSISLQTSFKWGFTKVTLVFSEWWDRQQICWIWTALGEIILTFKDRKRPGSEVGGKAQSSKWSWLLEKYSDMNRVWLNENTCRVLHVRRRLQICQMGWKTRGIKPFSRKLFREIVRDCHLKPVHVVSIVVKQVSCWNWWTGTLCLKHEEFLLTPCWQGPGWCLVLQQQDGLWFCTPHCRRV